MHIPVYLRKTKLITIKYDETLIARYQKTSISINYLEVAGITHLLIIHPYYKISSNKQIHNYNMKIITKVANFTFSTNIKRMYDCAKYILQKHYNRILPLIITKIL